MSWLLMVIGNLACLFAYVMLRRGVVLKKYFPVFFISLTVQVLSYSNIFIGPVGDSRRYITTADSCYFKSTPCGDRIHEYLLSIIPMITGPLWGFFFGVVVFITNYYLFLVLKTCRASLLSYFCLVYTSYQISNGMGELTYCLLIISIIHASFEVKKYSPKTTAIRFLTRNIASVLNVLAHPGNLFSITPLFLKPVMILIYFIFSVVGIVYFFDDLSGLISKSEALTSVDAAVEAINSKLSASQEYGDTSYGPLLSSLGFPDSIFGVISAIVIFFAPFLAINIGLIGFILGVVSFIFSLESIRLVIATNKKYRYIGVLALVLCHLIYGVSSYTPGIGLRHKVPMFVFCLYLYYVWKKKSLVR